MDLMNGQTEKYSQNVVDRTVKVAAISLRLKKWDKVSNVEKLEACFRAAARDDPEVIVAPEGAVEGYVVMDAIEDPQKREAMFEIAEPMEGSTIVRFRSLAAELRKSLCFGFAERVDDEIFNCAIFIGPAGEICGKYRKMQFAEGSHPSWDFNRLGSAIRAFDTPIGRAGMDKYH